ncbi:MAG: Txe/YoeB family addiction module toxin [Bacteroidetes bacterium CG_4_10_14_3_um_filter_31_20]|nr:MAG: Txe/YoeB family addiction module toxin [Bacteroidetes bacterium CG_4_10_14_3_um_filter_31_20]
MKQVTFEGEAYRHFTEWALADIKIFNRINKLIKDIDRTPFKGIGKPEPLKYQLKGCWSRRINDCHRLIYFITASNQIHIISCKGHYS